MASAILSETPVAWSPFWCSLYAISIGFGSTPSGVVSPGAGIASSDLAYLNELTPGGLRVAATLPTAACFRNLVAPPWTHESPLHQFAAYDPHKLLHGEQSTDLLVGALQPTFSGSVTEQIVGIEQKKSGVVVTLSMEVRPSSGGDAVCRMRSSMFLVGATLRPAGTALAAQLGGRTAPSPASNDARVKRTTNTEPIVFKTTALTAPHQAALYRLNGDSNPIHIDPATAEGAGLPAPILHGLCTYGILGRLMLTAPFAAGLDLRSIKMRFVNPVLAGESITLVVRDVTPLGGGSTAVVVRFQADVGGRIVASAGEAILDSTHGRSQTAKI